MAKKKKSRKKIDNGPKHDVPSGFWRQVGALILIAISILFIVSWFNAGGPILEWLHMALLESVGYSMFVIPFLFVYIAIEIFRAEDNRLPFVMKFATGSAILWFSSLFGLLKNAEGEATGGFVGKIINDLVLSMVSPTIAAFIYFLLVAITLMFILSVSPFSIIKKLWQLSKRDASEQEANVKVMRNAAALDDMKSVTSASGFKLNAGVPTMNDDKPSKGASQHSTFRSSMSKDKVAEEQSALVTISDPDWEAPSLDLLDKRQAPADAGDIQQNAKIIHDTLKEFDINVTMEGANIGPKVTQYTLTPPSGVKLGRITALEDNIALNLAARSLRMEAPIPGQKVVGIEVPNIKAADVRLHSILTSHEWKSTAEPLAFAIGKDISGEPVVGELNKMPHLLIAGQTGAGKSVMINTIINSLLYRNSPSEMKLILVDPKQVEMAMYEDIPHLLTPVIYEPDKTISALKWAVNEMQRRYTLFAEHRVKDIKSYNDMMRKSGKKISVEDEHGHKQEHESGAMPYIVIIIDELADMMMVAARDAEVLIVRLAQKARAVGIHLILATQRPSVNVITGLIKANIPARIAFTVSSQIESRIILDQLGAEKLLGQGDAMFLTASMSKPKRVQGALVTDDEIMKITNHLKMQSPPDYNNEVVSQPVSLNGKGGVVMDFEGSDEDDMFNDAVRVVVESGKASASLLQRRLRVGYSRAARLIESMENQGLIGPADGARPREVLISSLEELTAIRNGESNIEIEEE